MKTEKNTMIIDNEYGKTFSELSKEGKIEFTPSMFISEKEVINHTFDKGFHRQQIKTGGNKKLVCTKEVQFLIWNITEVATCPGRGKCIHYCYAFTDALNHMINPMRCRFRNYLETLNERFIENMIKSIESLLSNSVPLKKAKKIYFRIHESGDFYCVAYLKAWYKIAEHFLHSCRKLHFMAYTHSYNETWFTTEGKPSNFIIRESDNPDKDAMSYTAVESLEGIDESQVCECRACAECGKCYETEVNDIFVKYHSLDKGMEVRKDFNKFPIRRAYTILINEIILMNELLKAGSNTKAVVNHLINRFYR